MLALTHPVSIHDMGNCRHLYNDEDLFLESFRPRFGLLVCFFGRDTDIMEALFKKVGLWLLVIMIANTAACHRSRPEKIEAEALTLCTLDASRQGGARATPAIPAGRLHAWHMLKGPRAGLPPKSTS